MYPAVAELRSEGFAIRTVNVESYVQLVEKYRIRCVPTFVYVRDGQEIRRHTGTASKHKLRRLWAKSVALF